MVFSLKDLCIIDNSSISISILSREMDQAFSGSMSFRCLSVLLDLCPDYWKHSMNAADLHL